MDLSKPIDEETQHSDICGKQDQKAKTLSVADEFLLVRRILELQSDFETAFKDLKWHLQSVYKIDYSSVFELEDLDTKDLAEFADYINSKVDIILIKHRLRKAKTQGASSFELTPTNLEIDNDMSISEFTEINFVDKTYGISFVHTLVDFKVDIIVDNLAMLIVQDIIDLQEIEQEFTILEEFINKVEESSAAFIEFRSELAEISKGLLDEYKSRYCK